RRQRDSACVAYGARLARAPQHDCWTTATPKMKNKESINGSCREGNSKPIGGTERLAFVICLLVAGISARAGYIVDSHIEVTADTNYYTWTVYNQDQSWGLDGFAIEVPVETRILAHSVPAPYSNPD